MFKTKKEIKPVVKLTAEPISLAEEQQIGCYNLGCEEEAQWFIEGMMGTSYVHRYECNECTAEDFEDGMTVDLMAGIGSK
jgi:hypothetical protein